MGLRILWTVFCILQDSKFHQQKFPSFRNPFYEARKVKDDALQHLTFERQHSHRFLTRLFTSQPRCARVRAHGTRASAHDTRTSVIRKVILKKFLHTIRNSKFSFRFSHLKHSWRQRVLSVSKCNITHPKLNILKKKTNKQYFKLLVDELNWNGLWARIRTIIPYVWF